MASLGVSIYPSRSSLEEMKYYLLEASTIGYERVFTSLLELADNPQETVALFKEIIAYGNQLGLRTSIDVNPKLFKTLGISYDDLTFFADLGVWSIRLDEGFTGLEEARMTYNPYGLKIEVNISRGQHYIDMIADFGANKSNLIGSHNFYPQPYTGLNLDYFISCAKQYKDLQLLTAAFVDTSSGRVGPWPFSQLMVSAEEQRQMSLSNQIYLLRLTGVIDDLFISSSMASSEDLKKAYQAFNAPYPMIPVQYQDNITDLEKQLLLSDVHSYRGDYSDYMIRSSQGRITYKTADFPTHDTSKIVKGSITIANNHSGQYKGECQIALKNRPNDGSQNIVGQIPDSALILLDFLKPWQFFQFRECFGDK